MSVSVRLSRNVRLNMPVLVALPFYMAFALVMVCVWIVAAIGIVLWTVLVRAPRGLVRAMKAHRAHRRTLDDALGDAMYRGLRDDEAKGL